MNPTNIFLSSIAEVSYFPVGILLIFLKNFSRSEKLKYAVKIESENYVYVSRILTTNAADPIY